MPKSEVVPYWKLSVTVLRAELHHSLDYLSESDCYVILKLPTSSARTHRTRTVPNSSRPEWNETFHFRIHSHVKNVLEMQVYDEDPFMPDDLHAAILFDISNLTLDQKQTKMFIMNKTTKDELWVEFHMVESTEDPGRYLSNGVLVTAPFSTLEVKARPLGAAIQKLIVKLKGAYREECELSSGLVDSLRYYINRDLETELSVEGDDTAQPISLVCDSSQPVNAKLEMKLPFGKDFVDLELKNEERPEQDLAVRMDFDIPSVEKDFQRKRKVVVGRALQKLLGLSSPPDTDKVPLVGVVCSGGGTRAMTGTFGSLKGLQTLGILDTVSYITGVSGSTWAISLLYENADWSHRDLESVTQPIKSKMIKRHKDILSTELLSYYREEMNQKEKEGLPVSYIDMWGLAIEHLIYGKKWDSTLSDQRRSVSEGQNPLPIYTAVNIKNLKCGLTVSEWCEFNPYEVGLPKYGAFVPTEDFGSEYFLGHKIKKLPEARLPFLIGIWSSFFSISLSDAWRHATGYVPSWTGGDVTNTETDNKPSTLDTFLIKPATNLVQSIIVFLTSRPVVSQPYNFMRGLYLHWNYNSKRGFAIGNDAHPDAFPNELTPVDPTLNLVDAGANTCNIGIPPVLRPQRRMDLILSLNYSWDSDQFEVLKATQQHCTDHRIPFPHIDFSRVEKEPMKEVYVFEDEKNPKAPIVVHFPMVNISFRKFKAPGVKRKGKDELKQGEVDVSSANSPYITYSLAYQPEDFQKLMDLTSYNILNNRDTLLSALRRALQRERVHEDEDEHSFH